MKIDLNDGKYTYVFDNGKQYALRHGEEWRDLTGDNLMYWMACRIKELEDQLKTLEDEEDLKYELQYLAEDLARKEEGEFSGVKCTDVSDDGVKVYIYHDFYDFSAGETWYHYSWEQLKNIYNNSKGDE